MEGNKVYLVLPFQTEEDIQRWYDLAVYFGLATRWKAPVEAIDLSAADLPEVADNTYICEEVDGE